MNAPLYTQIFLHLKGNTTDNGKCQNPDLKKGRFLVRGRGSVHSRKSDALPYSKLFPYRQQV